jgi:hypothetical protein
MDQISSQQRLKQVEELVEKYLGPGTRAGKYIYALMGENWEDLFPNSSPGGFERHDYVIQVTSNTNQVVGRLFSMSFKSKKLFAKPTLDFENEPGQKLNDISDTKNLLKDFNLACVY